MEAGMSTPFYAEGLRFGCTRCGACCTGEPGFVFLSVDDVRRLLELLKLDFRSFRKRYCRFVNLGTGHALSLVERPDHSCVFWGPGGCSVYAARPVQCSSYPFWSSIMADRHSWEEEAASCPGIGQGELRSREAIEAALLSRRLAGQIQVSDEVARRPDDFDDTILSGS
jgi:Fe-S-cluster containining protein